MQRYRTIGRCTGLLISTALIPVLTTGCNNSHAKEAALVAQNGQQTAQSLADFYGEMASDAAAVPDATFLRFKLKGANEDDAHYNDLWKVCQAQQGHYIARQNVALALVQFYKQMENLAESKPDDVQASIANLTSALVKLNSGHQFNVTLGSQPVDNDLVTKHINKLVSYLYDLAKAPKIEASNQKSILALTELKGFVQSEEPVYSSDETTFAKVGHEYLLEKFSRKMLARMSDDSLVGDSATASSLIKPYALANAPSFDGTVETTLDDVSDRLTNLHIENTFQGLLTKAQAPAEPIESALDLQIKRQQALEKKLGTDN